MRKATKKLPSHQNLPIQSHAVTLLICIFDGNDLIEMFPKHIHQQVVISERVLFCVTCSWLLLCGLLIFCRKKWKCEESGFGKVAWLKGIVNDWRSNGWGCGEPSIRAPENEVRIKANVYLQALFAFEPLNGLIPSQQYIVTRKGSFPPTTWTACRG